MEFDVVIVGSVNVDMVVRASRLPAAGQTVTGGIFERHGGGKGANQAVAAQRLGAHVGLIAAVGSDDAGTEAVGELESEGVDVSHVIHLEDIATGVALIVVDGRGENQIAVSSGANGWLDAATVEAALASVDLTPDGVLLLGFEVGDEAVEAAARWGAASGHVIVLDPAPARSLTSAMVSYGPIVKPNAGEAKQLTGEADPAAAARALARLTGSPVVVTLGADGVLISNGESVESVAAHPVRPIDTTGAGDTFSGALAVGLASGLVFLEAVRRAQAAAAMSTEAFGARTGMPTSAELDRFLAGVR